MFSNKRIISTIRVSLHHHQLLTESIGRCHVQIAPGIGRITFGQSTKIVPEVGWVALCLRLRRSRHLRALRSHRALELLTNGLRGTAVTNLFVRHRIGAIFTEELTGVVSQNIRIGQDGLIGAVLVREFLEQANSFSELLVGSNQSIF